MVKISIIMPVYNDEEFLNKSIGSVLNQSLEDIELICVNDGSADGSLELLNDFAAKHDFIRVLSQENQGSGKARNYGLKEAEGEYIAFLDADDIYIDENALKELYRVAVENDALMVSGNIKLVNEKGEFSQFTALDYYTDYDVIRPEEYGIPWSFYKNIFKRDFLIDNNIEFPDLLRGQDPVFLAEILSKIDEVYTVPVDTYAYFYVNGANQCNTRKKRFDHMMHYRMTFDYLSDPKFDRIRHQFRGQMVSFINMMGVEGGKDILDATREAFKDEPEILNNFEECFYFKHKNHRDLQELVDFRIDENNPRISVIIPVYNASGFLNEAISNLSNQTFKDFEMIFIDYGSGDDSLDMLNDFASRDSRVKVLSNQHEGLAAARDAGLAQARGKYVYFFNQEDRLVKNSLEETYKNAIYNDADMTIVKARVFDNDGFKDDVLFELQKTLPRKNYYRYTFRYDEIKRHVLNDCFTPAAKLYKKSFLDSYDDFKFDIGVSFGEIPFHVKSMMRAGEMSFVNKFLYDKRAGSEDISKSDVHDIFEIIDGVRDFLEGESIFDEFTSEFHSFEIDQILRYVLASDSPEYYDAARDKFMSIDSMHLPQNHEAYDLVVENEEYSKFKSEYMEMEFHRKVEDLNNQIKILQNRNNQLIEENENLKKQNSKLKKLNDSILNSTSWKLTKPLRKIKNLR